MIFNQETSKLRAVLTVLLSLIIVWSIALFGPSRYEKIQQKLPSIQVEYPSRGPRFNASKLALLVEEQPLGHVTPLLLHMISVVPPDWSFLFLGSTASIYHINTSIAVQLQQETGKLRLREVPTNTSYGPGAQINHMFTDLKFYEQYLDPAEWLLVFQTDSILCARSEISLDDWLEYDWVGAPWNIDDRFGGSGGLSLRRISRIKQVLGFQSRQDEGDPEDRWLVNRLGLLPGAKMATPKIEAEFSVESIWHEKPMGYYVTPGGSINIWHDVGRRKQIYEYCPEIKMILKMKLERERCTKEDEEKKDQGATQT